MAGPNAHQLHLGLRVSTASIGWTVFASAVSIVLGFEAKSLALVAFGFTGAIDAAGSVALVVNFRRALQYGQSSDRHERLAMNVVTLGLAAIGISTLAASAQRLLSGGQPENSSLGLAVATTSVFVLLLLAALKRQIGRALPSAALQADAVLSFIGSLLAALTLVGTALADAGMKAADPLAAGLIGASALAVAGLLRRR